MLCSFGLVKSYDMPCNVESASLEPKFGDKFIAGGEDMWIRLFDFNTGEEIGMSFWLDILLYTFIRIHMWWYIDCCTHSHVFTCDDDVGCNKGHHGPVHCVRFSPGGESYASGSEDGTIRIWQTVPLVPNGPLKPITADEIGAKLEDLKVGKQVVN